MSGGKNISTIVDRTKPWVLCSQEEPKIPLSTTQVSLQDIFDVISDSITTPLVSEESDESYLTAWAEKYMYSYKFLDMFFPSDESILVGMIGPEKIVNIYTTSSTFFRN